MFSPVTPPQVLHVIKNLSSRTSYFDSIPTFLRKVHGLFFSSPIAHLVNLSFAQSVFPTHLKTGCIRPILKKSGLDIDKPTNYRPITILGTFLNIIEKLALEQLRTFIIGSTNFAKCQSAYRSAHSTETALLRITNDLRCRMEAGSLTCP